MRRTPFLLLVVSFFCQHLSATAFFPFSSLTSGSQDLGITLLKNADSSRKNEHVRRQKQLDELRTYKSSLEGRAATATERISEELPRFEQSCARAHTEPVKKIYRETIGLLKGTGDVYADLKKTLVEHESLLNRFIKQLEDDISRASASGASDPMYSSWVDFKQLQQDIEEQKSRRDRLQEKVVILKRDLSRLKDSNVLQKKRDDIECTDVEKELSASSDQKVKDQYSQQLRACKERRQERVNSSRLQEELAQAHLALQEDECALQEYIIEERKQRIPLIRQKISVSSSDVDIAFSQLQKEDAATAQEVVRLEEMLDLVKSEKKRIETEKKEYQESSKSDALYENQLQKYDYESSLQDEKRLLFTHKKELLKDRVTAKKNQHAIVKVMHERGLGSNGKDFEKKIDVWIKQFRHERDRISAFLDQLNDRSKKNSLKLDDLQKQGASMAALALENQGYRARHMYRDCAFLISEQQKVVQALSSLNAQHIRHYKMMQYDVQFVLSEIERDQRSMNIWQRSEQAVSLKALRVAAAAMSDLLSDMAFGVMRHLNPIKGGQHFSRLLFYDYFLLLYLLLFLLFFIAFFRWSLMQLGRYCDRVLYSQQGQPGAVYWTIGRSFVRFFELHGRSLGLWFFIRLHIMFGYSFIFMGMRPIASSFFEALFYVGSIPFFLYLSGQLMEEIKQLNQKMSYLFFTEKLQEKFLLLIVSFLFSSAVLLPLRKAALTYARDAAALSDVIYGAWTLILSALILFLFSKEDVLRLIPSGNSVGQWLGDVINRYYYPVFIFVMGVFILVNPYVGYSNLAVYLAICVPITALVLYAMLAAHSLIRKMSMYVFVREVEDEEGEVEDRFEHAKMYYGFFIVFSFLALLVAAFVVLTRVWGINYTLGQLWQGLTHDWVLRIEGLGVHIGFGGVLTLCVFILGGFIISSLVHRYVLLKLFDVFRVAYGAQNTFSLIFHYTIIVLSIILGLHAVRLGQIGNYLLFGLALGITFGLKDLVADFFAGLWILIERPIELNNFIETGNLKGTVKKIAMRATTIRTARNFSVVVPNRELVAKPIINWGSGYYAVGFEFTVTVAYDSDPELVHQLIKQVVSEHKLVLRIPGVTVRLEEFTENGMVFFCRAFVSVRRVRDQWDIASDVRMRLVKKFKENDITIPYPHRKVFHSFDAYGVTEKQFKAISGAEGDGPDLKK